MLSAAIFRRSISSIKIGGKLVMLVNIGKMLAKVGGI